MTSGELTEIDDLLRRAYADASAIVPEGDLGPGVRMGIEPGRPLRGAGRPVIRRRWVVPAAAGAAVAVVALVAGLIVPNALQHRPPLALSPLHMGYMVTWAGTVVPVNLATGTALRPIKTGAPGGLASAVITPDGRTVYTATKQGYVVPVDTVTRTAGHPIRIGGYATRMLMSPDGSTGYVLEPPYGIAVVDFALNKPAGFIKVHDALQFALTPDGKTLYVLSGNAFWTTNQSLTARVTPIDTATLQQLPPVQLPYRVGAIGDEIVAAPDGKTVYVLGADEHATKLSDARGVLTPISTVTNTALAPIQLPAGLAGAPFSVSPDSRTAVIGLTGSNEMAAVDLDTGAVRWTASVPEQGIPDEEISPDGKTFYAVISEQGGVNGVLYQISSATGIAQEKETIREVPDPRWVSFSVTFRPDGKILYVQSAAPPDGINEPNPAALLPVDLATGHAGPFIQLPDRGILLFGPS